MSPPNPKHEDEQGYPVEDAGYETRRPNPESDNSLPDSLKLKGNDAGISSTLEVNLEPYIASYKTRDEAAHSSHREVLDEVVYGVRGAALWTRVLNAALDKAVEGGRLSADECFVIQNSPACELMINSFVELVKNLMDEAILGHYEGGKDPRLELNIDIDASSPDRIKLTITDNGRGFPPAFLEKNSTPVGREAYILEEGSTKNPTHDKTTMEADGHKELSRDTTPPKLFGGAGLGLRIFMAGVLRGDILTGPGHLQPKYEKPTLSEISFSNREDSSGTMIQITTSRTRLQEKTAGYDAAAAAAVKLDLPPIKTKKRLDAAPAPSDAAPSVANWMKQEITKLRRLWEESTELADKGSSGVRPK